MQHSRCMCESFQISCNKIVSLLTFSNLGQSLQYLWLSALTGTLLYECPEWLSGHRILSMASLVYTKDVCFSFLYGLFCKKNKSVESQTIWLLQFMLFVKCCAIHISGCLTVHYTSMRMRGDDDIPFQYRYEPSASGAMHNVNQTCRCAVPHL